MYSIFLPYSISAISNLWTIADHLVYFNKNLLFIIYFVGNYKKYIKNNQYHMNTSFNILPPDYTGFLLTLPDSA
jgi:hypothetical protein